ncbi:uncharacterized protein LOC126908022 isoform X2 [Daktulosphaira vitifoliae]|nr:uncharacterized protein LOC126908022 isoform X2 [Daktulosphaira vitifoliae]XP_050545786.1 uncharacterized protein LOC126908022 isoform X2 [Daktulosphaira vitifoliae]XP_050545788.1 uncharacterized protein LOC126908022 isoform X2 [Daktulosphaira vitifoliae]
MHQYTRNRKNSTPLERSLKNINNMLNWIKRKKRMLLNEFHTNHYEVPINDKNSVSNVDKYDQSHSLNETKIHAGLPESFYNSTIKILEEYIRNKNNKKSKSNNNSWINLELIKYIYNLLKMSPLEIENLPLSSTCTNSSVQIERSILEMSKTNLEYHNEILNYISKCLESNLSDASQDRALSSFQYIGLLERLSKLAEYYAEKAQEMRNICLESPRVDTTVLFQNEVDQSSDSKLGDQKSSCSISSDFSADGAYIFEHLSTLLENNGLIRADIEWPMFGNDEEDDSRSLTDQLLDIKPRINIKDIPNFNTIQLDEKSTYSDICRKQCMHQYTRNRKNSTPLERSLKNINNMLNWIKRKKRMLLNEFHTNHYEVPINDKNSVSSVDKYDQSHSLNETKIHAGLPESFYNSTIKILEEYIRNKNNKKSKSNNNSWINLELIKYIYNLLKMSPLEIENLPLSSTCTNSSVQIERSILEMSKTNLEYHNEILNYISKCLESNLSDASQDRALSSFQYIGLLERLSKLAEYYAEKAQEMRNICLESPRVDTTVLFQNEVDQSSDSKLGDQKSSCSISSDFSADGAYIFEHLSTLLENNGLIRADIEWPMFGNDEEDDSRSLTDQLLDIKPRINIKDIPNFNTIQLDEKSRLFILST